MTTTHEDRFVLPDFCQVRSILVVVVIAELLVFVLVLAQPVRVDPWEALSLYTLFVQWVALGSAVILCLLRRLLGRLRARYAALAAWLVVLAVTLLVADVAARFVLLGGGTVGHGEFVLRSVALAAIVSAVALRYLYLQQAWRARLESASAARIQALQARIRPHFLFNSLNTIASMIPARPRDAEAAVEDLADLFRASLKSDDRLATLGEELDLASGYLRMEQLRLGERLEVEWDCDGLPADALLPPLTLQPLLENAIYHGVETRREGGWVRISGACREGRVELLVDNPAPERRDGTRRGFGMASSNVEERLALAYGAEARFTVESEGERYRVRLTLPYKRREP